MNTFFCGSCVDTLYRFNEWSTVYLGKIANADLTQFFVYVTDLFDPVNVGMYSLVLFMFLWLHGKNKYIEQFLFAIASTGISVLILKYTLRVPRPPHPLIAETGYSFASGHAAMSAVFILLCVHSYKNHIKNKYIRFALIAFAILVIILVGVSRVYLGVHYATDVVGGYLVGIVIYALSVLMFG